MTIFPSYSEQNIRDKMITSQDSIYIHSFCNNSLFYRNQRNLLLKSIPFELTQLLLNHI